MYFTGTHVHHVSFEVVTCFRALSDFDGDFSRDFGTEDSPADYCPRFATWSRIALKIGLKDAGPGPASFEPMYVWFGFHILQNADKSPGELFLAKILKVDVAEEY